jgi:hypothetical protein
MPLPLLVVMISASSAAPAGWLDSADTTPDTSSSEAAVECVLPDGDPADTTEPVETTEVVETTEPAEQGPEQAFFDGFCARAQDVAALGPFLTGTLTRDGSEQFRVGMCDPGFRPPDRDQSTINWTIYIRGTAQTETETAEAWVEAGVLSGFDEDDDDAIEVDEDVLTELVDIEMAFLDEFEANHDEWCDDLLETVETTEP